MIAGHDQTYGLTQLEQFDVSMPVCVDQPNEVEWGSKRDGKVRSSQSER